MTCSIEGCDRPGGTRGWCSRHYSRWLRHGDPLGGDRFRVAGGATCEVDGCTNRAFCSGFCAKHYQRWKRMGDPLQVSIIMGDDERRFWSKVDRRGDEECWGWLGSITPAGYPEFEVKGRGSKRAHRFAYELLVGPIPEGKQLDHLCRNRACVNPGHLEPTTARENTLRSENLAARNARKTHCLRGHPFDEENTYLDRRGSRHCRACARERHALSVI